MHITSYFAKDLFRGKTVFITGGSSGINLGIARNFAALGANLSIVGRSQEKLAAATAELKAIGAHVVAHSADVRDYPALEKALQETNTALGPVHTLICGAAGNFPCPAADLSPNGFKSVIDIDLLGSFHACRAGFAQLRETQGNIIFISAGMAFMPYAFQAHVGAAKAGIDNLMRNLALEWGPFGIRCNSIVPGPIEGTEGVRRLVPEGSGDLLRKAIPLGRFGTPDDIGQLSVFLASPLASYITGTVIVADGGQNLPGSGAWTQLIATEIAKASR
ncbi:MAG: SDR family oxidoreductase [Candidatus Competibacter denitrificans]|jgi:NAD(P)-dependent dehydrogenase (short-subunit alcohol dehydrogenase family)|uniref:Short-chain dehydrogenase/reductase SDR n=1 Tax=Candidatus Competibacter denitrificans Run_A_D11 TaxID=1400863 RepID=W6M2D8_9GAMM|nr:SDR family oxidoreductase [Candidatus Competibacter denitrificans]CDI01647.1 Short-chain dehydrogenase/reductase SDR [Candidatus Competibacter denitrificans Run_A_D11]HAS87146.1 KR domain-containing protein [Candidatus Competibacteraceae bacterium]HRC69180.1 SDR family oxidoreductase [Candidatus Competibacter denitrificans]